MAYDKRCIKCESIKDYDEGFQWEAFDGLFCKNCWRNNNNQYLKAYRDNHNWDLFYLRYPTPWKFTGSPSEKKLKETSQKDLYKRAKESIEENVKVLEGIKKNFEDRKDTSSEDYKYYENSLNYAKSQQAIIVNIESRYKN